MISPKVLRADAVSSGDKGDNKAGGPPKDIAIIAKSKSFPEKSSDYLQYASRPRLAKFDKPARV